MKDGGINHMTTQSRFPSLREYLIRQRISIISPSFRICPKAIASWRQLAALYAARGKL